MTGHVNSILVLLLGCCLATNAAYVNSDRQREFTFECKSGEHISSVRSHHSRWDSQWEFGCTAGLVSSECTWSGWANGYDQVLQFKCPKDNVITGVRGLYENYYGDRRFAYKCCKVSSFFIQGGPEKNGTAYFYSTQTIWLDGESF